MALLYKVSTTTQGIMKVVDPSKYKPTQGEKATIINKSKRRRYGKARMDYACFYAVK
ncbi:hypothetical protein MASR2M36_28480 [Providencia sp.]